MRITNHFHGRNGSNEQHQNRNNTKMPNRNPIGGHLDGSSIDIETTRSRQKMLTPRINATSAKQEQSVADGGSINSERHFRMVNNAAYAQMPQARYPSQKQKPQEIPASYQPPQPPPPPHSTHIFTNHMSLRSILPPKAPPPVYKSHQRLPQRPPPAPIIFSSQKDSSQVPAVPQPTRPHFIPSPTYTTSSSTDIQLPPSSGSRHITYDKCNASPLIIKPLTQCIPRDTYVEQKVGIGMGLMCTPLAIPTEDFSNDSSEHIPLIRGNQGKGIAAIGFPIRCQHCKAYFNPFVILEKTDLGRVKFTCNFCEKRNDLKAGNMRQTIESYESSPLFHGTVEYEVEREYFGRNTVENKEQHNDKVKKGAVHLFALDGNDEDKLKVYLEVLSAAVKEIDFYWSKQKGYHFKKWAKVDETALPRIGFFIYVQDHVIFPHWKRTTGHDCAYQEIILSLMADVNEDPFSPLPLSSWTYLVGCGNYTPQNDTVSLSLEQLHEVINCLPSILERECKKILGGRDKFNSTANCGGAALAILKNALHDVGGCGTLITSSRPNYGVGELSDRQKKNKNCYSNSAQERLLYTPQQFSPPPSTRSGSFYTALGDECIKEGISLNVIISSPWGHEPGSGITGKHYLDIATLGELCRLTCGRLKWLKYQDSDFFVQASIEIEGSYANNLKKEILQSTAIFMGHNAIFNLRCSSGIQFHSYLPQRKVVRRTREGGSYKSPELIMPCVMPDTCIAIKLKHRIGGIPSVRDESGRRSDCINPMVFFQTALLYTTSFGQSRVRVTTLALPAIASVPEVFRASNFDVLAAFITRQAINEIYNYEGKECLQRVRHEILNRCMEILVNYRKFGHLRNSNAVSSEEPLCPEELKLLPLFCMSIQRSYLFRPTLSKGISPSCSSVPTADERAYRMLYASIVSPAMAMLLVHPTLYNLTNMQEKATDFLSLEHTVQGQHGNFEANDGYVVSSEPYIQLPPLVQSSHASFNGSGVYLLDDGFNFFLFVGKDVSIDARSEIFSMEEPRAGLRHVSIPRSSCFGARFWRMISQLKASCKSCAIERCYRPVGTSVVVVVGKGGAGFRSTIDDVLEINFIDSLVEDASSIERKSYADFFNDLHQRIKIATM